MVPRALLDLKDHPPVYRNIHIGREDVDGLNRGTGIMILSVGDECYPSSIVDEHSLPSLVAIIEMYVQPRNKFTTDYSRIIHIINDVH